MKLTWASLFDFSDDKSVKDAIKALKALDKAYDEFIKTALRGSQSLKSSNAALVKSLDTTEKAVKSLNETENKQQKEIEETNASLKALSATYAAQNKQIGILEKQIKKLSTEKAQVKKKTEDLNNINKEAIKLEAQLGKLTGASAKEQANLKLQITEKRKALAAEAKEAAGRVTLYQKESARLNDLRNKYKDVALAQGLTSKAAKRLLKELTPLDNKLKGIDASVGQFQRNVGGYRQALSGLSASFSKVAGALGFTGLIFGIVTAFKGAFNIIKDFDSEMNNLASIADKTRGDLESLERTIRKVAKTSVNTAVEVAKTATALTSLGKSAEDIKLLLKPVNDLSIALKAQADEAGELLIQTLNAFGKGSDSAQEYADIIANIRASTALDFQRIKDALGFLAPTAKAAGVSFEKTGATLGVLVDNGIKAARAGRLMSSSFLRLAEQGLTLDEALASLNKTQLTTNDELELLRASSSLFGKESAALGLILASNIDKVEEYTKAFEDSGGTLDRLTKQQLKSLDSQLKILSSEYTEFILSIDSGEGVIASATKSIVSLGIALIGAANALGEFLAAPDPFKDGIIQAEELSKAIGFVLPKAIEDYENQLKSAREETEKMVVLREQGEKNIFALRAMKDEVLRLEGGLSVLNKTLEAEEQRLEDEAIAAAAAAAAIKDLADEESQLKIKTVELLSVQDQLRASLKLNQEVAEKTREDFENIFGEDTAIKDSADNLLNTVDSTLKEIGAKEKAARELRDANRVLELIAIEEQEAKEKAIRETAFEGAFIIGNQLFENNRINSENQLKDLQNQKAFELELAGDNAQRRAQIEEDFAKKEKIIRTKQAKDAKKQAIFNVTLNTALAVVNALATLPFPAAAVAAIAAGAVGAIQTAAIISQPLPAFEKGGLVKTDGEIVTSEKGSEMYIGKDGKIGFTGNKGPEVRSGMKGSTIIPANITKDIVNKGFDHNEINQDSSMKITQMLLEQRDRSTMLLAKTMQKETDILAQSFERSLKKMPHDIYNVTDGDLKKVSVKGNTRHNEWYNKVKG